MEYKEIFYTNKYGYLPHYIKDCIQVRFRYDAIPGSSGKWMFDNFYKTPRTTQELRWNEAHKEYVRGKRRKGYLTNSWDDVPRSDINSNSWKDCTKRKKQYK